MKQWFSDIGQEAALSSDSWEKKNKWDKLSLLNKKGEFKLSPALSLN